MRLSAPIRELKRRARRLARAEGLPLHVALDRVARAEGLPRWSLLAARAEGPAPLPFPTEPLLPRLAEGDLLLIGARPRQGKTLLGLRLLLEAARAGRRAAFFTLEYTEVETRAHLRRLAGAEPALAERPEAPAVDSLDAGAIAERLAAAPRGTVAVVDYLQLMDQRRDTPPLAEQLARLRAFARARGAVLAFLSQIDRGYDPARAPAPSLADVRRPNPVPVEIFSRACFLHAGALRFHDLG